MQRRTLRRTDGTDRTARTARTARTGGGRSSRSPRHWITGVLSAALAATALVAVGSPSYGEESGARTSADRTPVVFVHGYTGSGSNWSSAISRFRAAGYSSDELNAFDYNWQQSNKTSAQQLSSYIDGVLAKTGADKVDIVNHSMGGLVSQYYLTKLGGTAKVSHLASLAGANHGTTSASACTVYASCREMVPGSSFIGEITAGDETPGDTRYGTWYSACDGVILPYTSTRLDGATNNNAGCVNHLVFLTDASVTSGVLSFLGS